MNMYVFEKQEMLEMDDFDRKKTQVTFNLLRKCIENGYPCKKNSFVSEHILYFEGKKLEFFSGQGVDPPPLAGESAKNVFLTCPLREAVNKNYFLSGYKLDYVFFTSQEKKVGGLTSSHYKVYNQSFNGEKQYSCPM